MLCCCHECEKTNKHKDAEIALLRAALDEIVFTDKDPKAIATKALGWVRRDNQQLTGKK